MAGASSSTSVAEVLRRSVRGLLAEVSDALVSVFFPLGCRICEALLASASRVPICAECLASFVRVPGILCEICGRPLPGLARNEGEPLLCPACQDRTYAFEKARSFALYEGPRGAGDSVAEIRAD